jgi:predicted Zn-dependent protease
MRRGVIEVLALVGVLAVLVAAGCKGGPHLLSQEDEIRLGREAGDDFERQYGLDKDEEVRALIQGIGSKIAAAAVPPEYPYDFRVLARKEVNANAFPGGRIYVWRGLVDALGRDKDQLAWVMGHEAAHVARRHVTRRLERQLGYDLLIALVLGKKGAAKTAGLVADLVMLDYGRDQEYEADRYGLLYTYRAGYDPTAAVAVLQTFQKLQGREPSNFEIFFETHPGNNQRINAVKAHLKEQGWSGKYYTP